MKDFCLKIYDKDEYIGYVPGYEISNNTKHSHDSTFGVFDQEAELNILK